MTASFERVQFPTPIQYSGYDARSQVNVYLNLCQVGFLSPLTNLETSKWSIDAPLALGGKERSQVYPDLKTVFRAAAFQNSIMSISGTAYFVNNVKDKRNVWENVC